MIAPLTVSIHSPPKFDFPLLMSVCRRYCRRFSEVPHTIFRLWWWQLWWWGGGSIQTVVMVMKTTTMMVMTMTTMMVMKTTTMMIMMMPTPFPGVATPPPSPGSWYSTLSQSENQVLWSAQCQVEQRACINGNNISQFSFQTRNMEGGAPGWRPNPRWSRRLSWLEGHCGQARWGWTCPHAPGYWYKWGWEMYPLFNFITHSQKCFPGVARRLDTFM